MDELTALAAKHGPEKGVPEMNQEDAEAFAAARDITPFVPLPPEQYQLCQPVDKGQNEANRKRFIEANKTNRGVSTDDNFMDRAAKATLPDKSGLWDDRKGV